MKISVKKSNKYLRLYSALISIFLVLFMALFSFVFIRAGYHTKLLVKLGLREPTPEINYALMGWENCLEKLEYDADIVFFGDSITRNSDFGDRFPDSKIVNLGYAGDTIVGMISRVPMVQAVSPEKIFVMGGINSLTDMNLNQCVEQYSNLINELKLAIPEAKIYIQSVLPISEQKEVSVCSNKTIVEFNIQLQQLAKEENLVYVDLFALYEQDGQLSPDVTEDGVHIKKEAYIPWETAISKYVQNKEQK